MNEAPTIIPRSGLAFGLNAAIPKYWFAADPFKTRLFDAHSILTPSGEGFFIRCLRSYKDDIQDPNLQAAVKAFIFQEGQHSLQHGHSNQRLVAQGIDVAAMDRKYQQDSERTRKFIPKSFAMALTAAFEHFTTLTAHALMEHPEHFQDVDPHVYALYAWHCAEELEHKSVCFDVMQQTAKVGYIQRVLALFVATLIFQLQATALINTLLKHDGFSFWQRQGLNWQGLRWMYQRGGLFRVQLGHFAAYLRPGFHPSKYGSMTGYERWLQVFQSTQDPIAAGQALLKAA